MEQFIGDICNIGVHYIEDTHFRVSITSLERDSKGLNQLSLDLTFDQQSFDHLFNPLDPSSYTQLGPNDTVIETENLQGEIFLPSIEALSSDFYPIIKPAIKAYEEHLIQEFGQHVSFDFIVLENLGISQQIRVSDASEDSEPKVELWTLIDSPKYERFQITCKTMYKLPIKKRLNTEITRTFNCPYKEFNQLFGIKKT